MKPQIGHTIAYRDDSGNWDGGKLVDIARGKDSNPILYQVVNHRGETFKLDTDCVIYAPTLEDCIEKYPRLIRLMQAVAILSSYEAASAIRDYLRKPVYGGQDVSGGEAVQHFGGTLAVIRAAIRQRHNFRKYNCCTYGYPRGHSKFQG